MLHLKHVPSAPATQRRAWTCPDVRPSRGCLPWVQAGYVPAPARRPDAPGLRGPGGTGRSGAARVPPARPGGDAAKPSVRGVAVWHGKACLSTPLRAIVKALAWARYSLQTTSPRILRSQGQRVVRPACGAVRRAAAGGEEASPARRPGSRPARLGSVAAGSLGAGPGHDEVTGGQGCRLW